MPEKPRKVAFITGASRGIGKEIALHFGQRGYKTVCASRSIDDLVKVVEQITDSDGEGLALKLDVSDQANFQSCVKTVIDKYHRIDVLVNNAGIVRDKLVLRMNENDWDDVININLKGCFNGIKAVTRFMMKNHFGRIINITSIVGITGNAGQSNYASSKAGIIGLTKSVAKELASRNITVNAVAPGYIESDMTEKLSKSVREELINQIPLRKIGTPGDVAKAVYFLASEGADYITGQTISVNGGLHM